MRLISQLINRYSKFLQILLRYFNGTVISALFVPPASVWSVSFV